MPGNAFPNGDLSNTADLLGSSVPQQPFNTYPPDTTTSIQSGNRSYVGGVVAQRQFPGDASRNVAAVPTWIYADGNTTGGPYRVMRKTVTGLVPGYTYTFFAYVSNVIAPSRSAPVDPVIRFARNPGTGEVTLLSATVPDDRDTPGGNTTTDTWTLVQTSFVAVSSTEDFSLYDAASGSDGDDLAVTQIHIRRCVPMVTLTKAFAPSVIPTNGASELVFTLDNSVTTPSPAIALSGVAFVDNLPPGVIATAPGTLGSGCSGGLADIAAGGTQIVVSGLSIPAGNVCSIRVPVTSSVVSLCPGSASHTNGIANFSSVSSAISNAVTPQCLTVNGRADLSLTKTNTPADGVSDQPADVVVSGALTRYRLIVTNNGPDAANNAILRDIPAAGI